VIEDGQSTGTILDDDPLDVALTFIGDEFAAPVQLEHDRAWRSRRSRIANKKDR